jgi:hypothetical protein
MPCLYTPRPKFFVVFVSLWDILHASASPRLSCSNSFPKRIKKIVQNLEGDDEYYVRKAVTWIKRNFSKGK